MWGICTSFRLLGRLLPAEAVRNLSPRTQNTRSNFRSLRRHAQVQQLVCGEVIEPQRCPNAAVLTASLQAQDITEDVLTEQCRIDEFTCEQYINRQGVDDVESDVFMDAMGFLAASIKA